MKKFFQLLVAVMIVFSLAACSADPGNGDGDNGDNGGEEKTSFKVASHNAVIEGNPYRAVYEQQISEQIATLEAQGLIEQYNSFVSNLDPAVESQQIEQTINEGYDIILVNPISNTGLDPVIEKADEEGIIYINADNEYSSNKIINVVVDQAEWARIQGEFVIETLGEGASVVQFNGIDGVSASDVRSQVWVDQLTGAGIEIVRTVAHGWVDVEAKRLMSEIIASGVQFDGIINQEGAMGIMDAIEESNIGYPGVISSSEEVVWIRRIAKINENELVLPFIVVENPPGIGATALAIGVNLAQGNTLKSGTLEGAYNSIYYAPQWIMTYDNMDAQLASIADLPDSTSVSNYLSLSEAKAMYFE